MTPRALPAIAATIIVMTAASSSAQTPAPSPSPAFQSKLVVISPPDPAIRYDGRFDTRDKDGPRCQWPASSISIRFTGSSLSAAFADTGHNYWLVVIDGKPAPAKLETRGPAHSYSIATGLDAGEHIVTLTKATESFAGIAQFLCFGIDPAAKALPLPPSAHRIEVIGDSISCGYGVEAANQNEHFTPQTENAWLAYGALTARSLGAAYTCIAWSGRKMWPDDTIPSIYDLALPTDPQSKWDFAAAPQPDAVIINLGTNDFGGKFPDEAQWTDAYRKFLAHLRTLYPKAAIYCATGPMLGDSPTHKAKSTLLDDIQKIVAAENAAGDTAIRSIDFGQQNPADGIGADWHPSRKTHELMAAKLTATLQKDLGWK